MATLHFLQHTLYCVLYSVILLPTRLMNITQTPITMYTYDQLRDAVQECTSYDLVQRFNDDGEEYEYVLLDGCGDADGEPFYDLSDVEDFIRNNDQVDQYLYELTN